MAAILQQDSSCPLRKLCPSKGSTRFARLIGWLKLDFRRKRSGRERPQAEPSQGSTLTAPAGGAALTVGPRFGQLMQTKSAAVTSSH